MLDFARSLFNCRDRHAHRTRALDAAGRGRRWDGAVVARSLNADLQAGGQTVQARAAHYARNNAHATAALNALVANVVGPGIKPSSQHSDPATRERINALWADWTDRADYDGGGDFYDLQALAVGQMVEAGEAFGQVVATDAGAVPLQVRLFHADQVPRDWPGLLPGSRVRAGVELDETGRVTAYHVLPFRPDDPLMPLTAAWTPVRLPADDVVHLFVRREPGQLRGLSWFAPVLLALRELDQFSDAALVRAKVSALVMAALTDPEGNAGGLDGDQDGGVLTLPMQPGTILNLPPGTSLDWFDPKEFQNFDGFTKAHLRTIAAGLGIPYEVLTGDLEGVNYSSIRAGLVEFRKRLEYWQHSVVVHRFCRPIWDRFIETAGAAGLLPGYDTDPAVFRRVEWLPPRQEWVDPKKDAEAEILAIRAGLKSRTQAISERGYDVEQIDAELAAERAREARLGLTLDTTLPSATPLPEAPDDAA